jgi:phage repressor protein C with HTH and peptisase S24 domain
MKQTDVIDALKEYGYHLKPAAVCSWEKDNNTPNAYQFLALCKILGITNIYDEFIGGYNPENPFSELNEEGVQKAKEYIQLLVKSGNYVRENDTVIPTTREIRLFTLPASAGTGEFLDSDDYEIVEVGNEVSPVADFGIRINGDSMEPRYINGQIVWVQQTEELVTGDIGIFYLEGNAYCKKLETGKNGTYLHSLNPKYEPIRVTKENCFRVFGKVVC